jgi:hypothetical protein
VDSVKTSWDAGVWYHIVGKYVASEETGYLYVNGQLDNSRYDPWLAPTINNNLFIGNIETGAFPFNGTIDSVRIYNHSLSAEQIQKNFLMGNSSHTITTIVSNETKKNETWKAQVWINDGTEDSNPINTSEINIINTAPTVPYNLTPNGTYFNTNIINITIINSTDDDLDILTYNIEIATDSAFTSTVHYKANWTYNLTPGYVTPQLNETIYYYRINAYDGEENSTWSVVYNFTIDTILPLIELISPLADAGDADGNVSFTYNVSDTNPITNCSLIINSIVNQTSTSITRDTTLTFTTSNISVGKYNWSVNCTDIFNNTNESKTRVLTIFRAVSFEGATTNLSAVNLSNITNLIIEDPNFGKINYTTPIDLSAGYDLDNNINISRNRIFLNETNLSTLDTNATIYLYNLTYTNPRPVKDGIRCDVECTEISYLNNEFIFNVTGFSVYSAEETTIERAPASGGAGGTGGGGGVSGPGGSPVKKSFSTDVREIKISSTLGEKARSSLTIRNTGDVSIPILIKSTMPDIRLSENYFIIPVAQSKKISLTTIGKELGVKTGEIVIYMGNQQRRIPLILETELGKALFDVKLDITPEFSTISLKENLKTQVTLLNMGEKRKKLDLIVHYIIKDLNNNIVSQESETFAITDQKSYLKEFKTKNLAPGTYIAYLEVLYQNQFAASSQTFTITEELLKPELKKDIAIAALSLLIIILIISIVVLIRKRHRRKR